MRLNEISFIKPILIVCLVGYHCFLPYTGGGWVYPSGIQHFVCYGGIAEFFYSFMLETFTFVSGYIFSLQISSGKYVEKSGFVKLVKSKLLHLVLPAFMFGFLYELLFSKDFNVLHSVIESIKGTAHLWYLTTLFVCFVIGVLAHKIIIPDWLRLVIVFLISIFCTLYDGIPTRLSHTLHLFAFFEVGFVTFNYRKVLFERVSNCQLSLMWVIWSMLFIITSSTLGLIGEGVIKTFLSFSANLIGTFAFYLTALKFTKYHTLPANWIKLGNYCFGIYIVHQFIIWFLYYHTQASVFLGTYWLPWVTMLVTLSISLLLAYCMKRTVLRSII